MNVFHFTDYKEYVLKKISSLPHKGKGELTKISAKLKIHTTVLSQIFRGPRELTPEQACMLGKYFELNDLESEYFYCLVQHHRAGTEEARKMAQRQLKRLRTLTDQAENRLAEGVYLSEQERAVFYSHWYYSAARLMTFLPHLQTKLAEAVSQFCHIPQDTAQQVIHFLISTGLCKEEGKRIVPGPAMTLVEAGSPYVVEHHINWRLRAIERMRIKTPEEINFTMPMVISEADRKRTREVLLDLMSQAKNMVKDSPPEKLCCLNIDWFDL